MDQQAMRIYLQNTDTNVTSRHSSVSQTTKDASILLSVKKLAFWSGP